MTKIPLFLKINFFTYLAFYAIKTFVLFEITNPFWWIVELPNYSNNTRGCIILMLSVYYLVVWSFSEFIKERNNLK